MYYNLHKGTWLSEEEKSEMDKREQQRRKIMIIIHHPTYVCIYKHHIY
jgi:hypothetical protein